MLPEARHGLFHPGPTTSSRLMRDPIHAIRLVAGIIAEFATPESLPVTDEEQLRPTAGKGPVPGREQAVSAELGPGLAGLPDQECPASIPHTGVRPTKDFVGQTERD